MDSIKEKINRNGNKFSGLWASRYLKNNGKIEEGWSVTILYRGRYCDIDHHSTIEGALNKAIEVLEKEQEEKIT